VAYGLDPLLLANHAIGAAAGFAAFWALGYAYRRLRGREGLGLGDAKLLAGSGAWVSWWGLPSVVLVAALAGLTAAVVRSVAGRAVSLTD
jgi:leader peptidase (prepilin peptidase)/N-methyltransferase